MTNGRIRVHENVSQSESRKKAVRMLVAIVVMFALCFLPNHTLNILRYAMSAGLYFIQLNRTFQAQYVN